MSKETIKKISMYIPVYGVFAIMIYGYKYIKDYGMHFWLTAIAHGIFSMIIIFLI